MRRGLGVACLAALVVALSGGASAAPPATTTVPDETYPDEFKARVNAEIERGSKALLEKLDMDALILTGEHAVGERALILLTLLKCGVPKETPSVAAAFKALRVAPPKHTYDVGVILMALAARYDGPFDPFATDIVDAGGRHVVPPPTTDTLEPEDRAWMTDGVAFLVEKQWAWKDPIGDLRRRDPVPPPAKPKKPARAPGKTPLAEAPEPPKGWGYPGGLGDRSTDDWIDVSNVQYALLGLKAASRCGLRVPPATWSAALSLLLDWQAAEGERVEWRGNEVRGANRVEWKEAAQARGFAYTAPARTKMLVTGGRTAAGAVGLMICQSELWNSPKFSAQVQARTRAAVRDALAWMQANFSPDRNPGDTDLSGLLKGKSLPDTVRQYASYFTSYLYATERMGVLAHTRFLGEHDWYREGAEAILARRAGRDRFVREHDDCFELLFLKRASFRTSVAVITPDPVPAMDDPGRAPAPGTTPGK